jgi:hypothetical protein
LLYELFGVIAHAGGAEAAKVGKILSYLPGINPEEVGQIPAGDTLLPLF